MDSKYQISFPGLLLCATNAAFLAKVCTLPLEVVNMKIELEKKAVPKYRGMGIGIATPSPTTMFNGYARQFLFGGLRIVLYDPLKKIYAGHNFVGDVPFTTKILAALSTGAFATSVANPPCLVKRFLQDLGTLAPDIPRRYSSMPKHIARNAIINAAELATYDQLKQTILNIPGATDNVLTHLFSGLGAGFVATCVGSPFHLVKLRMMGDPTYKGTIDCFVKTLKNDGPFAFYKHFIPDFARFSSRNVIMFLTLEQAKKLIENIESTTIAKRRSAHDPPN